ncbi:hypothetical protein ABXS71_17050 [Bacillus infantis]|uniref:hypothetical protein n=1 Tax=Bacillus infantis TaxID=324767 RepID=UPI00345015B9
MEEKKVRLVNISAEIKRCKDENDKPFKIPMFDAVRVVDGQLVGELTGYAGISETYFGTEIKDIPKTNLH